jgi:hypothetical protein
MALNQVKPNLRLINGTNGVAKLELLVQPGDEISVPEGSVRELERGPLSVVPDKPKPAHHAAAKKAPAKAAK